MIYTIIIFTHEEPHNTVVTHVLFAATYFAFLCQLHANPLCEFASKQ